MHTIVFLQPAKKKQTRTYYDYPSFEEALEGLRLIFEGNLSAQNQGKLVRYTVEDLLQYYKTFEDVSAMELTKGGLYKPMMSDEVMGRLEARLNKAVAKGAGR